MNTIRVLIADDEPAARHKLSRMLGAFAFIDIVAEAEDGKSALQLMGEYQPDVAFLDIAMPEMTGMEVAQHAKITNIHIVFVTAYDHYAVQAFETHAADYLLKPVSADRLANCINQIEQDVRTGKHQPDDGNDHPSAGQLSIRHGSTVRIIEVDHIAWLESVQGYCRVWLSESGQSVHDQKSVMSDNSLAKTHSLLPENQFLRASRSAIINAELVIRHRTQKRRMLLVLNGFEDQPIAVSRRNASLLRKHWADQ